MESNPMLSLPFITLGMVFSILCTYGFWDLEYYYVDFNATFGNSSLGNYATMDYGDPYSYIFVLVFFIFVVIFFRAGWNLWKEALATEGQIPYRRINRRR